MKEVTKHSARASKSLSLWYYAAMCAVFCAWIIDLSYARLIVPLHSEDFDSYYTAAQALRFDRGAHIYSVASVLQVAQAHNVCVYFGPALPPYLYPPFLAIVLEPLTLLPCASAGVAWYYFNIVLWAIATLIMADLFARRWPNRRLEATTAAVTTSLLFLDGMYGLTLGQIHLVVLLGIVSALWLMDRGHPWLAGGVLAVITVIKILPALLILYYLARRRYWVVGGATIVGLALLALMLAVSGPATLLSDAKTLLALSRAAADVRTNEALAVTIPYVGWLVVGLIGLLSFGVVWKWPGDELLGACWMLCVMLLLSPLVWSFYLLWLTPTFCAILAFAPFTRADWRTRGVLLLFAALYLVLAFPLWLPLRPFATLALWAITGALYWRSSANRPSAATAMVLSAVTPARG